MMRKLFFCGSFLVLFASVLLATNYYVDNQQTSSGDGSWQHPWKHINEALSHLMPGDTLFIRGGINSPQVYNENLTLVNAGTPTSPIVVKAYAGEQVLIQAGNGSIISLNKGGYVLEDLIFDHAGDASDAIKIKSSYNVIRRCEIRNGKRDGIDLGRGDHNLIEYCTIHDFVSGSSIDAHGIVLDEGENNIIRYNEIYNCSGDCIQIYHGTAHWTEIIENKLYTTLGSGSENAIDVKTTLGVRIIGNEMYGFRRSPGSQGNALVIHHDADSVIVLNNDIWDCNGGIRIGGSPGDWPDYILLQRNLVHDLIDEGQYSVDGYGIQLDGLSHLQMYNNTFANIPGPLFWIDSDGAVEVDIRNNLFFNGGSFHGSEDNLSGTILVDYNGWFQCKEQLTHDQHPLVGNDPQFVDPAHFDYHLLPTSPCIDAGDPSFGSQYPGGRIDIGAFEYDSATSLSTPDAMPRTFFLGNNYPNPFNPLTHIPFELFSAQQITLRIIDAAGNVVTTLVKGHLSPGKYNISWNGQNADGQIVASGIYFYQLQTDQHISTRKMVFIH